MLLFETNYCKIQKIILFFMSDASYVYTLEIRNATKQTYYLMLSVNFIRTQRIKLNSKIV